MPPYAVGDPVVDIQLAGEVALVREDEVASVQQTYRGWKVVTREGFEHEVDDAGKSVVEEKSATLHPLDDELREVLRERGDGFEVQETTRDWDIPLEWEQDLEAEGLDHGIE